VPPWDDATKREPPHLARPATRRRTLAKRKLKSAKQRKYSYAKIEAVSAIDQIMEINESRPERGRRPMLPLYFNRSKFE
jgi:hypothetical protein